LIVEHIMQLLPLLTGDLSHCLHATICGNNTCGSFCTVFCDMAMKVCTGANAVFPDVPTCMTNCSAFNSNGHPGDQTGDTVQCRIYHLGVANSPPSSNLALHCPHAMTVSGGCAGAATTGSTTASTTAYTTVPTTATTTMTPTTGNSFKVVLSLFSFLGMLLI